MKFAMPARKTLENPRFLFRDDVYHDPRQQASSKFPQRAEIHLKDIDPQVDQKNQHLLQIFWC
jgi:serine/threonine protein kinase HipA of HipAB toxin-antitoxin module